MIQDFVRNSLQQAFRLFPDTAVYIDDSWNRRTHQTEEVRTDMNVTYTLRSVKDNIADIIVQSVIDNGEKTDSINVMGYEAIAELKRDQKGDFKVDTRTGMLMEGSSSSLAEGSLQLMGKEVPVKIKSEKKMSGKNQLGDDVNKKFHYVWLDC